MISNSFGINSKGHLTVGGADTVALAAEYNTPLYVMDEAAIRGACRAFTESINEQYGGRGIIAFASKAFCCKEIYRIINSEGLWCDVVSGGELFTALEAGFPAEHIFFHGNNKTFEELELAVISKVGYIVVDNLPELKTLKGIAAGKDEEQKILLRIKPGVDAHTHDFVKTGNIDSKFGFALETGEAMAAVKEAMGTKGVALSGIHCHIGSQIFDTEPFCHTARVMVGFLGAIKRECSVELPVLNLGGGFGVRYTGLDDPKPLSSYMKPVSIAVAEQCSAEGIAVPQVILEPGRSIVADGSATLYTVGSVKEIPGVRTYVAVDGGMTDNPRYALYHSAYEATVANRAADPKERLVTIAGRCCESGDLLGENVALGEVSEGDILAVLQTGAYNYSMAMGYNRVRKAAVVMVNTGEARLIVKRESYEDLVRNDI